MSLLILAENLGQAIESIRSAVISTLKETSAEIRHKTTPSLLESDRTDQNAQYGFSFLETRRDFYTSNIALISAGKSPS